jgi:hypothetical protein
VTANDLNLGVFQKGVGGTAVTYGNAALLSIALDFKPGVAIGTDVTIVVSPSQELKSTGMSNITIAVGTLKVQ